jgi:hypothetical protein
MRGIACLTMTATKTNATMTTNTMTRRMGRGCTWEQTTGGNPTTMVATPSAGRPLAAWGRGCRLRAPTPPPPSSTTMTLTTIAEAVGGYHAPPPSGPSRPARRRSSLPMSRTLVYGGGMRAFGAWSYTGWRKKFRALVLIRQVLIQPGVDDGGKRSGVTLVGLRGRKHQAGE